ncbi:antiviral reverse transcriptase Drt3a [Stenotrophomonas sp.]|uniref:antiviral reverse transcriptase Drt3a n=1 Tax=Stenotrophomonas sp. TaxID=69392 RepID=UPI0028A82560|nr:antiviral reverse transcriptase Drt3a [Stenotrophomonas sp.]
MHRGGLISHNIAKEVRKVDFFLEPSLRDAPTLKASIEQATKYLALPTTLVAAISYGEMGAKPIARAKEHSATIALRMLNRILKAASTSHYESRDDIVDALKTILTEQVAFTVIKVDVKSFYESFSKETIYNHIASTKRIHPSAKRALKTLVDHHSSQGHSGLPRGLVVSPTLANAMMDCFDSSVKKEEQVFFYKRFVDDIVLVMQPGDSPSQKIAEIEKLLPTGMTFKKSKNLFLLLDKCTPKENATTKKTLFLKFDYLGYSFHIAKSEHNFRTDHTRDVWLDIARNKIARTKTRIMKSYLDYLKTKDFSLLEKRIRHLTSNISIRDRSKGITRLSGIHFNYPLVDLDRSENIIELDKFLRSTLRSTKGRIFKKLSAALTQSQLAQLLRHSFYSGARNKRFYQFSPKELSRIQRCWKYE